MNRPTDATPPSHDDRSGAMSPPGEDDCAAHDHGAHTHPGHDRHVADRAPVRIPDTSTTTSSGIAAGATVYTCPMHPEIRRSAPGNCPICGMALEPVMPTLEDDNPELADFSRRFWWTLPLTIVVVLLAMFGHRAAFTSPQTQSWIELALSAPIVLWAGWPFFVRGAQSVANRSPNMWTLISLGVGVAFIYSVAATVAPQLFPPSFVAHGRIGVYYEAAAVIVSLTLLGQVLELKARGQTSAAIKSLLRRSPPRRRGGSAMTAPRRTFR
jgi:Cu+-exporting ATPase